MLRVPTDPFGLPETERGGRARRRRRTVPVPRRWPPKCQVMTASTMYTLHGLCRPLARALEGYADRLDVGAVQRAHDLAVEAHAGQTRAPG